MNSLYICRARYKVLDASTGKKASTSKMFAISASTYALAESTTILNAQQQSGFVPGSAWVSAIKRRNTTAFDSFTTVSNSHLVSIPTENHLYELYTKITRADETCFVVSVFAVSTDVATAKATVKATIEGITEDDVSLYSSVFFDGSREII